MAATTRDHVDPEVDETSERWVTAVHEAAHAVVAEECGARVDFCRVDTETTGMTRHNGSGLVHAVIAVAGERATRLLLGTGGGSSVDYEQAQVALDGTGRDLTWAETTAEHVIHGCRRDIHAAARRLYRSGRR